MRISDWSSDVCSSDLGPPPMTAGRRKGRATVSKLRAGLIQMALKGDTSMSPTEIRERMIAAHLPLVEEAGKQNVQVLCFQEVFTQPYFCPSQDAKWYAR